MYIEHVDLGPPVDLDIVLEYLIVK
ncbi:hypothetical protein A2U01_0096930, partial [Trifolium medium]|nr:hypothetical protein [Trifolium medium]